MMKTCTRCNQPKSKDEFYADHRVYDGRRSVCKQCQDTVNNQYRTQHKNEVEAQRAAYREAHKNENQAYQKQYRAIHRQELSEKKRAYYNQSDVRDAKQLHDRAYHASNKESRAETMKRWRQTDAGQASRANSCAKRRSRVGDNIISTTEWQLIMSNANWHCVYCDIALTPENRSLDHVVPLSKNGSHCVDNLVACCRTCNSSKKDKPVLEFVSNRGQI